MCPRLPREHPFRSIPLSENRPLANASQGLANASKRKRSAVSSGRKLFVQGDANSAWSRRYRDIMAAHIADQGGRELLSEAQLSLIRRASAIQLECEQMEGRLSMGDEGVDIDVYTRSASHLRRIYETLGLKRVARDVTPPTLAEYALEQLGPVSSESTTGPPRRTTPAGRSRA
jgi:hypothetical protein